MVGFIIGMCVLAAVVAFFVCAMIGETRQFAQDMKPSPHEVSDAEFFAQIARDEDEAGLKPWNEGGWCK